LPQEGKASKTTITWDTLDGLIEYPEFRKYIIGVVERCGTPLALCYDRSSVIEHLASEFGDYPAAVEYYEINFLGAYVGPTTPFFLDRSVVTEVSGSASVTDGEGAGS
jgi:hypothetical protein